MALLSKFERLDHDAMHRWTVNRGMGELQPSWRCSGAMVWDTNQGKCVQPAGVQFIADLQQSFWDWWQPVVTPPETTVQKVVDASVPVGPPSVAKCQGGQSWNPVTNRCEQGGWMGWTPGIVVSLTQQQAEAARQEAIDSSKKAAGGISTEALLIAGVLGIVGLLVVTQR